MEEKAWTNLKAFAESGGTVIGMGLLPYETIDNRTDVESETLAWFGLEASTRHSYWNHADNTQVLSGARTHSRQVGRGFAHFVQTRGRLSESSASTEMLHLIEQAEPAVVRLETFPAAEAPRFFLIQHRELSAEQELVFISNQEGEEHDTRLYYRGSLAKTEDGLSAELMNLATGELSEVPVQRCEDGLMVALTFAPYESHAIRLTRRIVEPPERKPDVGKRAMLSVDCATIFVNDQAIRMDDFTPEFHYDY